MIYDVDYFISKFEKIPEERWFTGDYFSDDNTRACAIGHCITRGNYFSEERRRLEALFCKITKANVGDINDDTVDNDTPHHQPTPKQRILAALYDIRKMLSKRQEAQASVATKSSKETEAGTKIIHHYHKVTVPESIETKELILS